MREYYADNLEKIKAIFIITYIKNQTTLNNTLISEEELIGLSHKINKGKLLFYLDFISEKERKDSIIDCYLYALSPSKVPSSDIYQFLLGVHDDGDMYIYNSNY